MKIKSPIIAVLFAAIMMLGFTACNTVQTENEDSSKIKVVSTIFPPYDFTRAISGENVALNLLLPPGAEMHSYEPTPQDIINIQNCDIFIYVGGESDTWVKGILDSIDTSKMKIISLMDCVEPVEEELVEGMQGEKDDTQEDTDEPEYDEHVWTSPRNAMLITQKISDALIAVDEAHAEEYRANTASYLEKLTQLDEEFKAVVAAANRTTLVFADRFPLRYFAEAYGLKYFAAYPGCSSEAEPSADTVSFLIDKVKSEEIPVVFYIELSNQQMADTVCAETGAQKLLFHSCHNVTKDEFNGGKTYLQLMEQNVENLKIALS